MIRRCVSGPETRLILYQCHHEPTGVHYEPITTAKKVLDSGFYWLTIIKDAHTQVCLCEACQNSGNISKRDEMPLNNIQVCKVFDIQGDENHIRTLRDYSRPSHEGYQNTIEFPDGNNVVPLRFDTIRLVQNGSSFYGLQSKDPNQHLNDFLKLVDSLDLDVANRERTRMRRTAKLQNDILMFQQHQGGSLSEAWTRFKDLLQKVPHHGIDLWLQVQIFYDHVNPATRQTIDQSASGKLHDRNAKESWALLEDLSLYDKRSWNDLRDFAKLVKAISLPQDVPSTSDHHLSELENQVQHLMEAHLAPKSSIQVNKIASSCEIYSGPHDTQYCLENHEQAFVDCASSCTDEVGGKWYTFKIEQNNLGGTYNPSWKSHPNLRWRQPQNSQNSFSNHLIVFSLTELIPKPLRQQQSLKFYNQSNLEGLVSNFMASQNARLSKFEADSNQQEGVLKFTNETNEITYKMPHKIDQYNSLSDLEKEHTKSVYLINEEDKRRGVEYVLNKILGFYKECLELGPEYLTRLEDEGGVT
nr:MAK10-like protein [Tanacetum cinerariifolium]